MNSIKSSHSKNTIYPPIKVTKEGFFPPKKNLLRIANIKKKSHQLKAQFLLKTQLVIITTAPWQALSSLPASPPPVLPQIDIQLD